ncbi:MAG: MFS transporter [Spirochaetaceae bacterium]|nr:MAG: MFS transporter [Spirochaetaceae bacterium]
MRKSSLSPGELGRARGLFVLFAVLNVVSFTLLSGNIITLYVLRVGAGNFLVGLLSSFMYIAYLFLFFGRRIAAKWGIVPLMGRFWMIRYLMMLPILASPFLAARQYTEAAYALIIFSVLGFNIARGVAIAGYNPIVGQIAAEKDRGAFLSRVQAIQHLVTLVLAVAMAFVLGRSAPLYVYSLFILVGIAAGLIAASIVFRFPEPIQSEPPHKRNLLRGLKDAFSERAFRIFILLYFCASLLIYMVAPFLVVYFKASYLQPDNVVLFFLVFGSAGAVLMALVSGFLIDKIGAKPLFFLFMAVLTLVLIPMVVSPPVKSSWGLWIFACGVLLFFNLGQFGILNAGQTYFLGAIKAEDRLDLGVIFFVTLGIAGALGSVLGGVILQTLESWLSRILLPAAGPDLQTRVFQIYFGGLALLSLITLLFVNAMENLGAYPIRDAMAAIFSPRDLRAISLTHRLRRVQSVAEEKQTLRAMGEAHSELSLDDVLSRLRSPRFTIRTEALQALADLPLNETAIQALISEVKNHSFTTAYLAADILGNRRIREGVPALRSSLYSKDFFLQGKSMVALARLEDRESLAKIRTNLSGTTNPRVIIHAASALELFRDVQSIPLVINKIGMKMQPYVRDELILSIAGILGFGEWFYPIYVGFLEGAGTGIALLRDFVAKAESPRVPRELLEELLDRLPQRNRSQYTAVAVELLETAEIVVSEVSVSDCLSAASRNPQLIKLERFLFLVAATIVWYACRPAAPY